jgi:hypothetical protein
MYSDAAVVAILVQAWTCLEDSRRLRLPDMKTVGRQAGT